MFPADVAIEGEQIAALGRLDGPAERIIHADGCLIMPGLVDAHVHLQNTAWNATTPQDYYRGTVAAALGGVTTVIDFATQRRGSPMLEAVAELRSKADGNVVIDYGLHMSITDATPATLAEVPRIVEYGISSFKMFMTYRAHNLMLEDDEILEVCRRISECGGLPGVHAENNSIAEHNYALFESNGWRAARYHALAKPAFVEAEAINRVLFLARVAGSALYIYHLSTAEGAELVRRAQRAGQPVFAETCLQYLMLTREVLDRPDGINWLCSPPLRDHADREALWEAMTDGTIAVISTDECGFDAADKARASELPLDQVPNGLPGVALRLPVAYTQGVEQGRMSLQRFVELNCSNPARIFGLYPRKGTLEPGSDADLIVIDPHRHLVLSAETDNMPVDWCPYEGMNVAGYPVVTVARGRVIVENYCFCGERGRGRFVPGHPWGAG